MNKEREVRIDAHVAEISRACELIDSNKAQLSSILDQIKEDNSPASDLVKMYGGLRKAKDLVDAALKAINAIHDSIKFAQLPEAFEREELKTVTLEDGSRVTISQKVFASIPADKRSNAFRWLRDNGQEGIIQETVNSQTLSAFAKEWISEQGKDLPEDLFKVHFQPSVTYTAGKGAKASK